VKAAARPRPPNALRFIPLAGLQNVFKGIPQQQGLPRKFSGQWPAGYLLVITQKFGAYFTLTLIYKLRL
jgi:hypothetical protein